MTTTLIPERQMRSEDAAAGQDGRAANTVANIPHIYSKAKGHGYWLNPRELIECILCHNKHRVRRGDLLEDNKVITLHFTQS